MEKETGWEELATNAASLPNNYEMNLKQNLQTAVYWAKNMDGVFLIPFPVGSKKIKRYFQTNMMQDNILQYYIGFYVLTAKDSSF